MLYFEDFPVGEVVTFGAYEVTRDDIRAFAEEYDPQPFHLDEEAARDSMIGTFCASGWHTCAMMMRLIHDGYIEHSAFMGSFGLDEVKWLKPVLPGDILSCRRTTLEARVSGKRPDMGIVRFRWEIVAHGEELKLDARGVNLFQTRAGAA